ncbi:hypothetical protein BJ912DRAFT_924552 [Pholiota molesta]|nr:hypothetical protein BJ912DRAFT_924552 [Pholiota molesta]
MSTSSPNTRFHKLPMSHSFSPLAYVAARIAHTMRTKWVEDRIYTAVLSNIVQILKEGDKQTATAGTACHPTAILYLDPRLANALEMQHNLGPQKSTYIMYTEICTSYLKSTTALRQKDEVGNIDPDMTAASPNMQFQISQFFSPAIRTLTPAAS